VCFFFVVCFLPAGGGGGGSMAEKRVKLKSSDDEMFEVEEAVAFESQAVKNMIEDTGMDHPIPLPNVSSKILAKVIEYCKYHVDNQKSTDDKPATPEDEIKAWDQDFVKVDQATLFDLILVSFPRPVFSFHVFQTVFVPQMSPHYVRLSSVQ
jgi:S-phase kinase-associated protein 1